MVLVNDEPRPETSEAPKLLQPRNHSAKISVWADLTVDDVDKLNESVNADHVKKVLSEIFHLEDYKESLKTGVLIDLYYYTIQYARDHSFGKEQTATLFSIVKQTHQVCIETPFGNVDQTFNFFKELILRHAVNRPPHSLEMFNADEVKSITEYVINTYFRHFKMYKYVFTPLVRLDLSMTYIGMPDPPPQPQELTEGDIEGETVPGEGEGQDATPSQTPDGDKGEVTEDIPEEESAAKKELRSMIKNYLADEMKKMKTTVDEQLKTTEETLSKKLEVVEGGPNKKVGRASPKGKKK